MNNSNLKLDSKLKQIGSKLTQNRLNISFPKSPKNLIKINANAERGDRSAKLVVKVDLGGSWAAFGKDLGGVWASKLEPS